jgi:diguanylate cyclase (GGDEF)-like protein
VAVVFLDLDGFKTVNDVWGHDTGDAVLRMVARALENATRVEDTLARLGGDEFAVLLEDVTPAEAADAAARLNAALGRPLHLDDRDVTVRASIGIAATADSDVRAEELLRRADLAMYAAKNRRDHETVVWSTELEGSMVDDQQLAADLRNAVRDHQLRLVYQPIVNMATGRTEALEALCRWDHPVRGPVGPDRFIPIAERSGLIEAVGRWVLETATFQAAAWMEGGNPIRVAVNVSGRQLNGRDLARDVRAALSGARLPANLLELEVTETALVANMAEAVRTLRTLKELGVRIAIDDFGTGYSSLAYLGELPVDAVKIDKSFIDRIGETDDGANLVDGVVRLAHGLGLKVVAEGVEGAEQDRILREIACDAAQGFLYARPVSADEATGRPPQGTTADVLRRARSGTPV